MKARTWVVCGLAGAAVAVAGSAFAQAPPRPNQPVPSQVPVVPPGNAPLPAVTAPNIQIPQAPQTPNEPAAQVNGEAIPLKEVDDCVALMKRSLPPTKQVTDAEVKQMRLEAAMMLVDNRLMEQFLRQNAPQVTQEQIKGWFAQLEAALKAQNHTMQDFLQERNLTPAKLQQTVVSILQWESLVNSRVTEAELKRHYEANKDFFNKISVRVSHIVVRIPATTPPAEREAQRARLAMLRNQIVSRQADFASAAKKYSQCTSAPNGGDLGYISSKGPLEENLTKAAFALKVGEVSDVVHTDIGLHLVTVTDRKDGQPVNYEHIKDFVKASLSEEMQMNLLEQQRKVAKINIYLEAPPGVQAAQK